MNWTQIEGRWLEIKVRVKSRWAKLTDDDVDHVAGKRDQLVGKLQERYGVAKDDAEDQINRWIGEGGAELAKQDDAKDESANAPPTRS